MTSVVPSSPIVVALDVDSRDGALSLVDQLDPTVCRVKVGKELFTAVGPQIVHDLHSLGFGVFLDLKFHDIPATVAKAVKAAADLGVWMVNVHASGGRNMLEAAVASLSGYVQRPLLIGVTLLTSFSEQDFREIGGQNLTDQILRLASLAGQCGLDGVVCSALESQLLKQALGRQFLLVTPGIRPAGADVQDQQRIMTPVEAVLAGSDYLVIGRPITQAVNPAEACSQIAADIAAARGLS